MKKQGHDSLAKMAKFITDPVFIEAPLLAEEYKWKEQGPECL